MLPAVRSLTSVQERDTILVDAHEDRWAWRARLKRSPRTRRIYRVAVGVVGSLLVLLGLATGWLPGPGGIPLVLLGLAVLASEFEWAHRLLQWAKAKVISWSEWARAQPRWVRWSGGAATLAGVVGAVYVALLIFGVPSWLPGGAENWLTTQVPGLG